MDHRRHHKSEGVLADRERVALADEDRAVGDVAGEELVEDRGRCLRADDLRLRIADQDLGDGGAVVRLHVVDDEVVELPPVQHGGQILEKLSRDGAVHRVDQHGLLIEQDIGVVGHAPRDGIDVLEQLDAPVADADIDDVVRDHADAADAGEFLLALEGLSGLRRLREGGRTAQNGRGGESGGSGGGRFQEISSCDLFAHFVAPLR